MKTKAIATNRSFWLVALMVGVLALVLATAVQPARAMADDSSSASASAESSSAESAIEDLHELDHSQSPMGGLPMMGNDYVWFGNNLVLKDVMINNDLIAAGQTASIQGVTTLGDMRVAGKDITITDSMAYENITVGGETVIVKGVDANAVILAGKTVSFDGTCSDLSIFASDVFIDGTVHGDVVVGSSNVVVGTNARITGTLYVSAPQDPVMERGAEVANVEYTKTDSGTSVSPDQVTEVAESLVSTLSIVLIVLGILGTLIIAVLAEWLFKRHTAAAAELIRTRTGAFIGTGIIGAIAAPIVVVILCCLVVTLPVAGVLTLALLAMTFAAGGFAGASLFKLAFPRLGRFKCALIGGAIMGVASVIPVLGSIVGALAFMYFLGYVLQSIFLGIRKDKPVGPAPVGGAPVAPESVGGAPVAPAPAGGAPVAPAPSMNAAVADVAPTEPVAPVSPVAPAASDVSEPPVSDEN